MRPSGEQRGDAPYLHWHSRRKTNAPGASAVHIAHWTLWSLFRNVHALQVHPASSGEAGSRHFAAHISHWTLWAGFTYVHAGQLHPASLRFESDGSTKAAEDGG